MSPSSKGYTLDHLAIATTDGVALERYLEETLHGRRDRGGEHRDEGDAFRGGQWLFSGNGKVEVLEPLGGPESRMGRFLRRQPSSIHHVTFFVDDLARATARAREVGIDLAEGRPVEGWTEAYFSPKQTFGLLFQLVSADSIYEAVGLNRDWAGFSGAPALASSSPATITALRLGARSRTAAERLLRDGLGGEQVADLRFQWPGTATVIQVVLGEEEGPLAIEIDGGTPSGLFVASPARQLDAA